MKDLAMNDWQKHFDLAKSFHEKHCWQKLIENYQHCIKRLREDSFLPEASEEYKIEFTKIQRYHEEEAAQLVEYFNVEKCS